jgi:glycosyltransferase involved in cell wall biosynthesis
LVKAYVGIPVPLKERSRLEIFGKYDQSYVDAITYAYLSDEADRRRVTFHGRFSPDDIPGITNRIDISVLPSLCADTAPQTIFESFNAGLPIIAPRVGGFPDFIVDGENGLLYPAGDVEGLMRCLAAVLEDVSMIGRFRERIPRTKTIPENVRELLQLYRTL